MEFGASTCKYTLEEWRGLCERYGNKCLRCGATDRTLTRDHILPLVLGGLDEIDNVQPLCKSCNSWKHVKVIDFRIGNGGEAVPVTDHNVEGKGQWLTVDEAARTFGISAEAIRGRIRRNTIPSRVINDRRVVWISEDDQTTTDQPDDRTDVLIAELQDRVRSLEDANRENRRIIAALTSRIPAIEAPETVEEASEGAEPHPGTEEPQEAVQRPWWRRWFGG